MFVFVDLNVFALYDRSKGKNLISVTRKEEDLMAESIFVDKLMKAREKAGLTRSKLAQRAGVSLSTVIRIERGNATKTSTLEKLARAMGATVTYSYNFK